MVIHKTTHFSFKKSDIALIIAPHPDDEILGLGGFLAQQAQCNSQNIHIVYLTDGDASNPDIEKEAVAKHELIYPKM